MTITIIKSSIEFPNGLPYYTLTRKGLVGSTRFYQNGTVQIGR